MLKPVLTWSHLAKRTATSFDFTVFADGRKAAVNVKIPEKDDRKLFLEDGGAFGRQRTVEVSCGRGGW